MMRKEDMKFGPLKYLDKDLARGIMKTIILSFIQQSKTYPYALLKHMREHNSPVSAHVTKNDIYNMTAVLEKEGYIRSKKVVTDGKVQKMYTITAKGRSVVKNRDLIIKRMALEMKSMLKEEFNE